MLDTEEKPALRIEALPLREQPGFLRLLRQWPRALRNQQNLRTIQAPTEVALARLCLSLHRTSADVADRRLPGRLRDRPVRVGHELCRANCLQSPRDRRDLGRLLQMVGFSRSDDDVFSVQDFLRSREAVDRAWQTASSSREFFSHSGRDFVMAFPSFRFGDTTEEFYEYVQNFVDVVYNNTTGITTLTSTGVSAARRLPDGLGDARPGRRRR